MASSLDKYSDKICSQRKANGDPCQSPVLHGERFCHYHKLMGPSKPNLDNGPSGHTYLPVFEDAVAIQGAISDVCEMMLHRRIEPKEASILLYAMQVASINMAHLNGDQAQRKHKNQKKNPPGSTEPSSTPSAPSSSAAPSSATSSANASSTTSSEAQPMPPGTIQACEQTPPAVDPQTVGPEAVKPQALEQRHAVE
jgi:hypothetical protein